MVEDDEPKRIAIRLMQTAKSEIALLADHLLHHSMKIEIDSGVLEDRLKCILSEVHYQLAGIFIFINFTFCV
jgi:hypothetical protein